MSFQKIQIFFFSKDGFGMSIQGEKMGISFKHLHGNRKKKK